MKTKIFSQLDIDFILSSIHDKDNVVLFFQNVSLVTSKASKVDIKKDCKL